jgi:hypothetical protein
MYCGIIRLKPTPLMDAGEYMQLSQYRADSLRQRLKLERWDRKVLALVYNWAGHVARMATYDGTRLCLNALHYKDLVYLDNLTVITVWGQRHQGKFKVWRYEQSFKFVGLHWKAEAQDTERWAAGRETWINKRVLYSKT